ncbi:MAG TPA: metallophosphoesterase [Anaerolineae bacterium]|nr:metallophosphoesterase [Anaerolineae bacterium]
MPDQTLTQPIKGVASPGLHRLILFTEWLARLSWPGQVSVVLGYTAFVMLVWGVSLDSFAAGFTVALVSLFFTLIDWIALAQLPRRRRSYGPIAPGVVLFGGLRCILSTALALFAGDAVLASTLLLVGHLALTGYALDSMWGEPFRVGVTRLVYRSPKLDGAAPIRIAHLSDFHVERLTRREEKVLSLLDELRPDLIVYTGDLLSFSNVDDPVAQAECRELMSKLRAPLGVFAVPGTPLIDTESALEHVLSGLDNVTLLKDSILSLSGYPPLRLIGLSCTHNPALDGPRLERLVEDLPSDNYRLLLYHTPDLMPEAARCGIDLVLCGHTHGGQVRLPLFGALFTSSIYWKRYEMGEYREGHTTLYVSRGIGMEGKGMPRMRFLCEPEIELIELRGTRAAEDTLRERAPGRPTTNGPHSETAVKQLLNRLHPIRAFEERG